MRQFLVVLMVFLAVDSALGFCGICGKKSGVMCRDRSSFSFCSDETRVDAAVYPCPGGTICGDDYRICGPEPQNPCNPVCGNCTSRYACLSETTYALCFGLGYPSGQIYICPEGTVCSTQKQSNGYNVCFKSEDVRKEEVDCYKNIVVQIEGTNGGVVLLPPILANANP